MANNSVVTQDKLQEFYDTKIYDYLNGATHTGCVPLGTVIEILGSTVPTHFLECDGTVYNINEYSDLANFFEDQFGSKNYYGGDGTTTFAVPTFTATQAGAIVVIAATNAYIDLALDSFPIDISNPTDGQALVWNGSEGRWKNAGILHEYSTAEKVVATWIDGKPVYEKSYYVYFPTTGQWTDYELVDLSNLNIERLILFDGTVSDRFPYHYKINNDVYWDIWIPNKNANILSTGKWAVSIAQGVSIVLRYTKTTDTV